MGGFWNLVKNIQKIFWGGMVSPEINLVSWYRRSAEHIETFRGTSVLIILSELVEGVFRLGEELFGFLSGDEFAFFCDEADIGGVFAGIIFEEFIPDEVTDLGVLFFDDGIEDIFMAHGVGVDFI